MIVCYRFDVMGKEKVNWDVYVSGFYILWIELFYDIDWIIEIFGGGKFILNDSNVEWVKYWWNRGWKRNEILGFRIYGF